MIFTDYFYIPFVCVLALIYFLVPLKVRWLVLLVASISFYCTWGAVLLPFAFGATLIAWLIGIAMDHRYEKMDLKLKSTEWDDRKAKAYYQQSEKKINRRFLWIGIVLLLGELVYTKAGVYFVEDRNSIIVPLGISYYSMSLVGYLADVYWRKEKAEANVLKLFLYAIYFPKILEGPISKHKLITKQLNEGHTFNYERMCFGLQRMLWGYFKKLVIADRLAMFVTPVLKDYKGQHGSMLLVAAIFGAIQLYCDFSGAMDIALGTSEVFGITIEENFDHPFFAQTAAEFWRRWHITLGVWFKDYIYMPLVVSPSLIKISGNIRKHVGKRAGKAFITAIPLLIVWLLTGLWHGTGENYIVWGLYWGIVIMLSTIFEPELKKIPILFHINVESIGYKRFRMLRTSTLFVVSRIISMPSSIHATLGIFKRILLYFGTWELVDGSLYNQGMSRPDFILVILCIYVLFLVSRKQEQGVEFRKVIAAKPLPIRWFIYIFGILFVLVFGVYGAGYNASAFVYMNY